MRKLRLSAEVLLFFFVGALIAFGVHAQVRTEATDAATASASQLHCTKSSTGDWECNACASLTTTVTTDTGTFSQTREVCGRGRVLKPANANRVQIVAAALVPQALRNNGFDSVDAGVP